MKSVFLTGGNGFVGGALLKRLYENDFNVFAAVRANKYIPFPGVNTQVFNDILDLPAVLSNVGTVETVIHIAAKAHSASVPLSEFRNINTNPTVSLARMAAICGVKRFIFLSSIGVNGIFTTKPFSVEDTPAPVEDYALSKLEAENGLKKIAAETGMELVIIRPPLVYGAQAPGNFGRLLSLAQKNYPLPLGAINNRRSLVAIDNLVDLILTCIVHPKAANQTFLISDDHDLSTTELLSLLTRAAGKQPMLLPVPVTWLKAIAKLTGKHAIIDRLCSNLQVDILHTKETLGWKPPVSVEEGIRRCFAVGDLPL